MRRMIPGILIEKIKNLFTSVWTDKEGNVEVGKNLEVDGKVQVNGEEPFVVSGENVYTAIENNTLKQGVYYYGDEGSYFLILEIFKNEDGTINEAVGITAVDTTSLMLWHYANGEPTLSQIVTEDEIPNYYRHHLTLTTAGGEEHQDYYSRSNLVVDSLQDLSTITGKHPFGSGENEFKFNTQTNLWERWTTSGTDAVTKVVDDVQLVTN